MRLAVQIRVRVPAGSANLARLSSRGAAHLLLCELDTVLRIHGPDGEVVLLHGAGCLAHERGLDVDALVEAPSAQTAETGLALTVQRVPAERAEFAGWSVVDRRSRPGGSAPAAGF